MTIPRDMIDATIAHYRDQKAKCLDTIDLIENKGWRFFEAHGDEAMRDITETRLERQRETVARMDQFIAMYEAL